MVYNIINPIFTFLTANGVPAAGGTLFTYVPGTTTLKVTYSDYLGLSQNTNPIVLSATGTCTIFGDGQYRLVASDSLGNVVFDQVTQTADYAISLTTLGVSSAMLPVVQAATLTAAEALLIGSGATHLTLVGDETLSFFPIANNYVTYGSLNVTAAATQSSIREFMVNFGMTSAIGSAAYGNPLNGKVTLYLGMQANPGTGDVWAFNPCLTMAANSGTYNSQTLEIDTNNLNTNRGASGNLTNDFTPPVANGISLSGSGTFSSTTAIAIEGVAQSGSNAQWNRGITVVGKIGICGYQDWATSPIAMQFDGAYSIAAINFTSVYGNAGAVTGTALFIKNAQNINWQTASTTQVIGCFVDAINNMNLGVCSVAGGTNSCIMGAQTLPQTSGTMNLGSQTARWLTTCTTNVSLANGGTLYWQNGANTATVYDLVDGSNNRWVGLGSAAVFVGSQLLPYTAGLNLGSAANFWSNIYQNNGYFASGIYRTSDIRSKEDVTNMPPMLDVVNSINPIKFTWIDKDKHGDGLHYGFNADHIKNGFEDKFAAYHVDTDGKKWLAKDELIAVLWKSTQEMSAVITGLQNRISALETKGL